MTDPQVEPKVRLLRNPVSIAGAVLTTITGLLFVAWIGLDIVGVHANHYLGLGLLVLLPGGFIVGLAMIPFGAWREGRRLRAGGAPSLKEWPRIDLNVPRVRNLAFAIAVLTPINLLIVSLAGYKAVEVSESTPFCAATCHPALDPEAAAHQAGPHAQVDCVDCHVGEGADAYVKAKIGGAFELLALLRNSYERPLKSPVHKMRPANETCGSCHWTNRYFGDKVRNIHDYADDETNTESITSLRLHLGGRDGSGQAGGIHWHAAAENVIEYAALDDRRQEIAWVRRTTPSGGVVEYRAEGVTEAQVAKAREVRRMDCIDCHNRPAHAFARTVEGGVNSVISSGGAPKDLPFLKREAVAALKVDYASQEEAGAAIEKALTEFYRKQYPSTWTSRQGDITRTIASLQALYKRNIFPSMKLTWGYHPDNRGHADFPGCFRCHDDNHKSKDGKVISQDCALCHEVL